MFEEPQYPPLSTLMYYRGVGIRGTLKNSQVGVAEIASCSPILHSASPIPLRPLWCLLQLRPFYRSQAYILYFQFMAT